MDYKNHVIAVVGPTSSGKSELAVKIAKAVDGEIISADSRQIYRGMDIGTGKVEGSWKAVRLGKLTRKVFVYKKIPHYLIDEASPLRQFTVAQFQTKATKIIDDILSRGKVPIICGGTGHWIDAVVFAQKLPAIKPDTKLRARIAKMQVEEMYKQLKKLDPERAREIDSKNPRRLVRALEIVMSTGKPVPKLKTSSPYNILWIGLNPEKQILERKILKRLKQRINEGMEEEVRRLHASGLSWKKLEAFGLEYKYCAYLLQGKLTAAEMESQLFTAIKQYTKRQMTWWKRNPLILWSDDPSKLLALAKTAHK